MLSHRLDTPTPTALDETRYPTQGTENLALALGTGPARAPIATGTLLGDWRIDAQVGEGGMGTVYAATHAVIGKQAALKVVRADLCASPETSAQFVQEARAVNQIGHPNILDIFHIGQLADGRPYLVMELLRGRTLRDRMHAGLQLPEAIDILLQVCDALIAAHAHGVVHCDLKPDNIFLADTHAGIVVKLVDWGISRLIDTSVRATPTDDSGVFGTPRYVSPEQARGEMLDPRTDIYSLGAIAFELLVGVQPFVGVTAVELIAAHLHEQPRRPLDHAPELPASLEALLLAMLAKNPAYRPSLVEVSAALMTALQDHLEATAPMTLPPAPRRMRRTLGIGVVAAAALVAALVLVPDRLAVAPAGGAVAPAPAAVPVDWAAVIAALPGTLDLSVTPRHARISLDGVELRAVDGRLVQSVSPGQHELVVDAPGHLPYRRALDVHGSVLLDARLDVAPRLRRRAARPSVNPDGWIDPFQ